MKEVAAPSEGENGKSMSLAAFEVNIFCHLPFEFNSILFAESSLSCALSGTNIGDHGCPITSVLCLSQKVALAACL